MDTAKLDHHKIVAKKETLYTVLLTANQVAFLTHALACASARFSSDESLKEMAQQINQLRNNLVDAVNEAV